MASDHDVARVEGGRWAPGQSGNPGGRPKGPSIVAAILRNMTDEDADAIAKAWIRDAKRGKLRGQARDSLADRIDGAVRRRDAEPAESTAPDALTLPPGTPVVVYYAQPPAQAGQAALTDDSDIIDAETG